MSDINIKQFPLFEDTGARFPIIEEETDILKTGIRVVEIEVKTFKKLQRFCLKCGKILPTKLPQYYTHNCQKPDFIE